VGHSNGYSRRSRNHDENRKILGNLCPALLIWMYALYTSGSGKHGMASSAPNQPTFTIVSQDQLSLTDQHIASLIADKLISQGYAKAESLSKADVGVLYSFRVGQGVTHTTGVPDYATGGTLIGSSTSYPRFLEIILVDLHRSKIPESVKVIWQGEIRSSGSISNMSALAPGFVDVIFENYGTTVSNKSFTRVP
jgi:hypothetical protein